MADKLTHEQIALSTIVSEAFMAKAPNAKCVADRADVIVRAMLQEPEVVLLALGFATMTVGQAVLALEDDTVICVVKES